MLKLFSRKVSGVNPGSGMRVGRHPSLRIAGEAPPEFWRPMYDKKVTISRGSLKNLKAL
ncbi:MAG: hypothetical protein ACOY90_15555 [Candidatus Zhuqueibacterota bacterium]